jgi:hypothetical protein
MNHEASFSRRGNLRYKEMNKKMEAALGWLQKLQYTWTLLREAMKWR